MRCLITSFAFTLMLHLEAHAAPPKVDSWFPAGLQQGQTLTVTAAGAFGAWPVKVWVDREGLNVEPSEKKGELKITAAPQAAGVYWLRLYDEEGASAPRPLLVGALPEAVEVETNDDPLKPQALAGSSVVHGKLAKRGDVDTYSLELKQGQTLVASLLANNTFGAPMDGVLQVCNADGFVLAQNDDERGYDPQLTFPVSRDGKYLVRTFAFPVEPNSSIAFAGAENYVYRLTISTEPFVDHTLPLAVRADESTELRLFGWNLPSDAATVIAPPGEVRVSVLAPAASPALELAVAPHPVLTATEERSPETPQPVETPVVIAGRIETPKDQDAFRFQAAKGQKWTLRVESRSLGFPLDGLLQVTDGEGKVLAESDDAGKERDPVLAFTAPADGAYQAVVRDLHGHGGLRYVYQLTIEPETPDFRLTLAADSFVITPGKPLEIPITVERRNSFAGEIEIIAEGLPPGVAAAPVKSLPSGDTAKAVKLILTAESGPTSTPFQLVGTAAGDTPRRHAATFPVSGAAAPSAQPWLTVTKAN